MSSSNNWKTQTSSGKNSLKSGFQEKDPYFYLRIQDVYNRKTKSQIDLHGLSKYGVEIILPFVFYYVARLVLERDKPVTYRFIVGKGIHSEGKPQLPEKVQTLCESFFGIQAYFEEVNTGILVVEVSVEKAAMIRAMERIKEDIRKLRTFKGGNQNQRSGLNNGGLHSVVLDGLNKYLTMNELRKLNKKDVEVKVERLLNGFSNNGFYPIVLKYWSLNLTEVEIIQKVWADIINLVSEKFLLTQKISLLRDSPLLKYLHKLYQKKPKSLQSLFQNKLEPERKLYTVYTFTEDESEIDFNDVWDEQDWVESFSPSEKELKELLQTDVNLIIRFTEKTAQNNESDDPLIYKELQKTKSIIDSDQTHSKSILLIIHLSRDSDIESNFLPFDSKWEQFMIDSLMN